jgi:glycine/D-amino acid oxidase-like deaminating enzyme
LKEREREIHPMQEHYIQRKRGSESESERERETEQLTDAHDEDDVAVREEAKAGHPALGERLQVHGLQSARGGRKKPTKINKGITQEHKGCTMSGIVIE